MSDNSIDFTPANEMLGLATEIITAFVSNNTVTSAELPDVIKTVYCTLAQLGGDKTPAALLRPAVPIKRSYNDEHIICLEDGKKLKMLKRYLRSHYGMSPEEYRAKWGLPLDYPMVAPSYAAKRSAFAKQIGLGKKR